MRIRNYINIILIILWMITIFNFSHQTSTESSGLSDKIIVKIAETVKNKPISELEKSKIISKYNLLVRKGAHFCSYFILGFLTIILLIDIKGLNKYSFFFTLIFCFLYACTDEIHQLLISGRNGSFIDVIIDTLGSLSSITITYIFNYLTKYIKKN